MEVYAIGNLTLDIVLKALNDMPPWGVEIPVDSIAYRVAGNLGNFSLAANKLGINPIIIGNIGSDFNGQIILKELKDNGLDTSLLKIEEDCMTSLTIALVKTNGERTFLTYPGQLAKINGRFLNSFFSRIKQNSIVILCSLFQFPNLKFEDIKNFLVRLKNKNCQILLDTGWDLGGWNKKTIHSLKKILKIVDIFIPNYDEAKMITGYNDVGDIINNLKNVGVKNLILKIGKDGSIALIDNRIIKTDPYPSNAIDTTGAGDTFNAALIYGILNKFTFEKTLNIANAASSLLISKFSALNRFPTLEDIEEIIIRNK